MKNLSKITLAAVLAATFGLSMSASADRIAASPKVRQMLNDKAAMASPIVSIPVTTVTYRTSGLEGVTASPKGRQMLADRKVVVSGKSSSALASAGYNPTGADGVTASPKLRSQLGEGNASIVIAPLK